MQIDNNHRQAFLHVATGTGPEPVEVACDAGIDAIWLERGTLQVTDDAAGRGPAALLQARDRAVITPTNAARWVRFSLRYSDDSTVQGHPVLLPPDPVLLRLDEVKFPPGAVAYRHVHPGAGYRVLTAGALDIISDTHSEHAMPGHAWFEPANSPVRAEASKTEAMTSFVRFMVLPAAFHGHPTIQVLDPEEAKRPRLQRTHRHIDELLQLSSSG